MPHIIEQESKEEIEHPHVEVPTRTRFLWGMGGFADSTIVYGVGGLVNVIYVNALGINAVLVNLVCAIPRFLDFVTDPLVGHLSDNTRSRWGRRRPWMLAGLIISAVLGLLLWFPPRPDGHLSWVTFAYLSVMMSLLYAVGYAFFNITHMAMGYEMTTDYNERTHLFKWRFIAFAAGGFVTPWFLPMCMWLEGPQAQVLKGSQGVITVSLIVGALMLLTGLPSVFFCREKILDHKGEAKISFFDAIKLTFHNKPFWLLVISNFITKFGMSVTGIFFVYIFLYHITQGDQKLGSVYMAVFFNAINIANFIAMAPIAALTDRIGKKTCLLLMLAMSGVAYASLWFTFINTPGAFMHIPLPWGAAGNSLSMQWPCLITGVLIGVFTNTMPMIKNSMLADVCDLDELKCGHRREAFYGAVFVTTDKVAMAVSTVFQGVLLVVSGFNASLDVQPLGTVRFWLLALVITQPLGFLIGLISIFMYPLTRARSHEIRAELDSRKRTDRAVI